MNTLSAPTAAWSAPRRPMRGLPRWMSRLWPLGGRAELVERTVLAGPQGGAWLRAARLAGPQEAALPVLAIVVPAFNDAPGLRVFLRLLESTMEGQSVCRWSLVFVDNGSSDNTWATVRALAARHPHVRGVRLARRVRRQAAVAAGLGDGEPAEASLVLDSRLSDAALVRVLDSWLHCAPWGHQAEARQLP